MSQTDEVLALLRERGILGLTPLEALEAVGTLRLSARIMDLRDEGYDIETQRWTTPSGKVVARYVIHEQPEQLTFDSQHGAPEGVGLPPAGAGRGAVLAAEGQPSAGSRFR